MLDDPKRPRDYSAAEQYLKSPEEMAELFADLPEALENTVELAKRCNLELSLGTYYLPDFPVPGGYTLDSWIRDEAARGLDAAPARSTPMAHGFDRRATTTRASTSNSTSSSRWASPATS